MAKVPFYFPTCAIVFIPACWVVGDANVNIGTSISSSETGLKDVNVDGLVEVIKTTTNNNMSVWLNQVGKTNMLTTVTNSLGSSIHLEYERSKNTYKHPQKKWLLSRVAVTGGKNITANARGTDYQLTAFEYNNGFHNRYEREFYGFETVKEKLVNTNGLSASAPNFTHPSSEEYLRVVTRNFNNESYALKGKLINELLSSDVAGNTKFTETKNVWGSRAIQYDEVTTFFPYLSATTKLFYEGTSSPISTHTAMVYDDFGNVTTFVDEGDTSSPLDNVSALIEYESCPETYVMGLPKSIVVKDSNHKDVRIRTAKVDCLTGKMTELKRQFEDGVEITTLSYDKYGNLAQLIGAENANGEPYTLDFTYDNALHQYPSMVKDSFGLFSKSTYNTAFGKPKTTIDTNGHTMSYEYDDLGRTTAIVGPYEQGTGLKTIQFEYHPEATSPYAITRHLDKYRDP